MQYDYVQELDLSQQYCYGEGRDERVSVEGLYKQYKNYDMSPEEINERCEAEMDAQYKLETEGLEKVGVGRGVEGR